MGSERKPVMVFISNLRTLADMTDLYPVEWHERVRDARVSPGYIASPPFDIAGVATGYLVLMLRSGQEVMKDQPAATALTMEMVRYSAEELDGDVIGLGSLTTSITKSGLTVAELIDRKGWKIRATHGDSGSAAAILECLASCGITPTRSVAVVGAYGVIGSALSSHLAAKGHELICCGPRPEKLFELGRKLYLANGRMPGITTDIRAVRHADCVITVTSHTSALLVPGGVKAGAIVIDPAVPANTKDDPGWHDPVLDRLVVSNASQVRIPGVAMQSWMFGTFDDPDGCATSYACFAETIANAVAGDRDHHVGDIVPSFIETTRERFAKLEFAHATPRMFGKDIRAAIAAHRRA